MLTTATPVDLLEIYRSAPLWREAMDLVPDPTNQSEENTRDRCWLDLAATIRDCLYRQGIHVTIQPSWESDGLNHLWLSPVTRWGSTYPALREALTRIASEGCEVFADWGGLEDYALWRDPEEMIWDAFHPLARLGTD